MDYTHENQYMAKPVYFDRTWNRLLHEQIHVQQRTKTLNIALRENS